MHEYDISLKMLLRGSGSGVLRALTGDLPIEKWLDVEMPEMRNTRVDLLGQTADGGLVHIELQSTNDAAMPVRMLEYCLRVRRLFERFPRQILLYVGEAPLRMESELTGPDLSFRYKAVDIRELDGETLLGSDQVGDNVISILARLQDANRAVLRILERIVYLAPAERETALAQLLILAGLRRLEEFVEREARKMPLLNDIMENKVLGREFRRGLAEGERKGEVRGALRGELTILRRQIQKRFGAVPSWADERLGRHSATELEELSVRLLDVKSIEELLG